MKTTVTSKGQVTIPKSVRDHMKLHPGDQVDFVIDEQGAIQLRVIGEPITKLKGMAHKPKKAISIEEMQTAIENG